jgi:hypothetical protein
MGVQKFRTIEEMNAAAAPKPRGNSFERFIAHCELFRRLGRVEYRSGVWRYRTLEEAQNARLGLRARRGDVNRI